MQVKEIMTLGANGIAPDATLKAAAQRMETLNVGLLPVCTGEKVLGIVTDRDIVVRGIAKGADPVMAKVRGVMSEHATCCYEDQSVEEAASIMREHKVRRLPVLDRKKRMQGMLSLGDFALRPECRGLIAGVYGEVAARRTGVAI